MSEPAELRALTAAACRCVCGRMLYEHSRRRVPNSGIFEYTCGRSGTGKFESATAPAAVYDCNRGLVVRPE